MVKPTLIAIDFDGTITDGSFPKVGKARPHAFEVMKELQKAGYKLILNTCRENNGHKISEQYLTDAVNFCKENGVEFRSVNETLIEDEFRPNGGRKVYASVYIDDRNLGGFPGWLEVRKMLLGDNVEI